MGNWHLLLLLQVFSGASSQALRLQPLSNLPDYSTLTVAHLAQLLESGETEVETEVEVVRVRQLWAVLSCSGVSKAEKLRPQLTPGQCAACLGYVQYIT